MSTSEHSQRSPEWQQARLGHVTASRFADVMTKPKAKADLLSKTADEYLCALVCEHLTQRPTYSVETAPMRWGTEWEPVAREMYEERQAVSVEQVGFMPHPRERFVGGSPDGLVGDAGCIEIKCPIGETRHFRVWKYKTVPEEHVAQVQGIMWVTGRQWCDFVSFHPHFPVEMRLAVVRMNRDDAYLSRLHSTVVAFRDAMMVELKDTCKQWEEMK